jgi:hypothetical protein
MNETHADQRQCPTRRDGRAALFTHRVTEPECQSRQRGMFHRCFTCAYNNSWVARNGPPVAVAAASDEAVPAPLVGDKSPADSAEATVAVRVIR